MAIDSDEFILAMVFPVPIANLPLTLSFFQDRFQKFIPTVGGQLGTAGQGFSYSKSSGGGQAGRSGSAGQYGSDQQHHRQGSGSGSGSGSGPGSGGAGGPGGHAGRGGAAGTAEVGETGTGKYPHPRVKCLVPKAEKSLGMRPGLGVGCRKGLLRYLDGSSGSRGIQRHVYSTQKSYLSVTFLSFITCLTPGYHGFANHKQLLACFNFGPQPLATFPVQSSRLISISS